MRQKLGCRRSETVELRRVICRPLCLVLCVPPGVPTLDRVLRLVNTPGDRREGSYIVLFLPRTVVVSPRHFNAPYIRVLS